MLDDDDVLGVGLELVDEFVPARRGRGRELSSTSVLTALAKSGGKETWTSTTRAPHCRAASARRAALRTTSAPGPRRGGAGHDAALEIDEDEGGRGRIERGQRSYHPSILSEARGFGEKG